MRTFMVLCLVVTVATQYEYASQSAGSLGGADDYSGAIGAPAQNDYSDSAFVPAMEYDKEFFTFSAPEGEFGDSNAAEQITSAIKKSLRVVFIKGPENNALENAALQLAKSTANERTAIYVLNKQPDIGDLANKLNNLNRNKDNSPEVHFVKYRTQADAEEAQRSIQAQYDNLPGSSRNTNGGAAPVLDFASMAPVSSSSTLSSSFADASPTSSYIPPQSSYLPPGRRV